MDPKAYEQMASLEDRHWWFLGRRRILSRVIARIPLPPAACILEVGCGSGGNLEMLSQFGQVFAVERSEIALPIARARGIGVVAEGELPHRIPFGSQQFDLIALLDVLEHLEEDKAALEALTKRLKPSGYMVITVPAYPWLWSTHDELNHHKRRYTPEQLRSLLKSVGLETYIFTFFNSFLFPLAAGIRLAQKSLRLRESQDLKMPLPWVNWLLAEIFAAEAYLIPKFPLPFGLSLLAVASPRKDALA
jgi:SAM-dependent methyltransferase